MWDQFFGVSQADPSPFAIVSLVQLRKLEAGNDFLLRYSFKVALTRLLLERRYPIDWIRKLFRFMDFLMVLPRELSVRYRCDVTVLEEELKVHFKTSLEQLAREEGRDEGRDEGREEGIQDSIIETLEVRFGKVPESLTEEIRKCDDRDALRKLLRHALTIDSLEAFQC